MERNSADEAAVKESVEAFEAIQRFERRMGASWGGQPYREPTRFERWRKRARVYLSTLWQALKGEDPYGYF